MHPSWNFHKATRNANSSWLVFPNCCWTLSHATGLSDVPCQLPTAPLRCPSPTPSSGFLCPTLWLAFPCLLLVTSRSRAQAFVYFHAKTDKGIICLTDHPHSVTILFEMLIVRRMKRWTKNKVSFSIKQGTPTIAAWKCKNIFILTASATMEGNYSISNWYSPKSERAHRCYSCHNNSTE